MVNRDVVERLLEYDLDAPCATIEEVDARLVVRVVPNVLIQEPNAPEQWQKEVIALMEAIAEKQLGGAEVSLPEKCAIALRQVLGQRASVKLAQYLTA